MTEDDFSPAEQPSKSQRKREAHAQRSLGERLTTLPTATLDKLPLPDGLRGALDEFNRLPNSHGARKRQLQFIGKLMRRCDPDAIELALVNITNDSNVPPEKQHRAERLCERILSGGDTAINDILSQFPELERQQLRQLYRAYSKQSPDNQSATRNKLIACLKTVA